MTARISRRTFDRALPVLPALLGGTVYVTSGRALEHRIELLSDASPMTRASDLRDRLSSAVAGRSAAAIVRIPQGGIDFTAGVSLGAILGLLVSLCQPVTLLVRDSTASADDAPPTGRVVRSGSRQTEALVLVRLRWTRDASRSEPTRRSQFARVAARQVRPATLRGLARRVAT